MNQLHKAVRDYLTMRRGLGFKLVRHEAGLREFVSFLSRKRSTRITVNLALECDGSLDGSPAARSAALSAQTRSAILLFRSRNSNTAEGC